ncbi:hypothetical protein Dimus_012525 [Dionaea muscipula]
MGEGFTIQISSNLVDRLEDDNEKSKKKIRKPKQRSREPQASHAKAPQKLISEDTKTPKATSPTGWPLHPPLFLPVTQPPPPQSANPAVEEIRSAVQESERVLDRLQKHGDEMLKEVTQRAKQLHEKEFKLPYQKPMPCLAEKDACLTCYKEHVKDPLKCADAVKRFKECARLVRLQAGLADQ